MYILIIASAHPTRKYPLSGIFEFDQAKALVNAGNKVIMACPDIRSIRRKRKLGWEHSTEDGVEIYAYSIPVGVVPYPIAQFFRRYSFEKLVNQIIRDHGKPDIAHAHFGSVAACSGKSCKERGIPFVVTEHSSAINKDIWTKAIRKQAQNAYRYADTLIVVSAALGSRIKANCGHHYVYVPNIVDTDAFSAVSSEGRKGIAFFATGSLLSNKGFDVLIDAFVKIHAQYSEARLFIIGDGPEKRALDKRVAATGLTSSITFVGFLTRTDITRAYQNADFFVLASRAETFGVVYIEALACGLPVIATRCGGPEGFVTQEDGILVPVDDVDALSAAMEYMIVHRDDYDRVDISKRAKERFSPAVIAGRLMEVYADVTERNSHTQGL